MLSGWGLQRLGHTMAAAAAAMPGHEEGAHQGMPHAWQAAAGTVPAPAMGAAPRAQLARRAHLAAVRLSTSSISTNTRVSASSTTSCSRRQWCQGRHTKRRRTGWQAGRPSAAAGYHCVRHSSSCPLPTPHCAPPCPPPAHLDLGEQAADELARLAEPLAEQAVGVDLNEGATLGVPAPSALSGFIFGSVYARELEQQQGTSTKCTGS